MNRQPHPHITTLARADTLFLLARLLDLPRDAPHPAWQIDEADLWVLADRARLPEGRLLVQVIAAAGQTDLTEWQHEFSRLFEGAGVCLPNETAYIRRDKGAVIADVQGFYSAFGFAWSQASGEKADHIIGQIEFTATLMAMGALAETENRHEDAQVTDQALVSFVTDHLAQWMGVFSRRLGQTSTLALYKKLAVLLDSVWQTIALDRRWPAPLPTGIDDISSQDQDGSPYECGMAEAGQPVALQVNGNRFIDGQVSG